MAGLAMPRALYVMLLVLAHAALPLWPLTIAGVWVFPMRALVVCLGAELLGTMCALVLFITARVDRARVRSQEAADREQVLIIAVDRLCTAETQPMHAAKTPPTPALRALS